MKISEIMNIIDTTYPLDTAEDWDNVGLLLGAHDREVNKIGVVLDITTKEVEFAKANGIDLIISHHPIIFHPLKMIAEKSAVYQLVQNNIAAIAVHTNADKSGMLNIALLKKIGVNQISKIENSFAAIGSLETKTEITAFAQTIKERLSATGLSFLGSREVSKICVSTGAGFDSISYAVKEGCDCFITSDVKHSQIIEAYERGICLIILDHFDSENVFVSEMKNLLTNQIRDCEIIQISQNSFVTHI